MSAKQREYLTSLIKILFTVLVGGLAAGKLFEAQLNAPAYTIIASVIVGLGLCGYLLQKE